MWFWIKKKYNDNDLCFCKFMVNFFNIFYICKYVNDESGYFCIVMNCFNFIVI